jgi:anti-sigma factor RsiW
MSEHETVRNWLALSAAGLLECGEERRVLEHTAGCAECAAELEEYAGLSAGLRELPAPHPPAQLVARTAALMLMEADRRQGSYLAAGAAILVFVLVAALGQTLRMMLGDQAAYVWILCAVVSSLLGAAAALVLTASRRRCERRIV